MSRVVVTLLLLLFSSLAVPTTAPAERISIPITSASFTFFSGLVFFGTFTAQFGPPPDFVFTGAFTDNPFNSPPGCFSACTPGSTIFPGQAFASGSDLVGSFQHGSQRIAICDTNGHGAPGDALCLGNFGSGLTFGPAVLPPFQGNPTEVLTSGFSIGMNLFPVTPFSADTSTLLAFAGSGTTVYDIAWQPDIESWRITHFEGDIPAVPQPVPEPSTFLLLGTTAMVLWRAARGRGHKQN